MTVITETKLEFSKLGSRIGAEIRGLDLSGDLSAETVARDPRSPQRAQGPRVP
jgi:alpha-ketoglutarate-dependent taurine dioxygenase